MAATGGIAVFYLSDIVLGFFGIHFAAINGSGPIGIGFSVFVVIMAALNLVLDFDFIESGVRARARRNTWSGTGVRIDGHADLAVPGDSAAALEAAQP